MMRYFLVFVAAYAFILCAFSIAVNSAATLSPQAEITALKAQVRLLEDQLIDARAENYKPGCTLPSVE